MVYNRLLKKVIPEFTPFDVNNYTYGYDTNNLVDGDMTDDNFKPWVSKNKGDTYSRYKPTTNHGEYGVNKPHFNYTKRVENLPYYQNFGKALLDKDGNFTELGKEWAKAVDALLPQNSEARFYDSLGNLRTSWNPNAKDIHGRDPKSFNNLRDYVNYVRNDQILGARHNIFLNRGKRYYYLDNNNKQVWVSPEEAKKYTSTLKESAWNDDNTIWWDDYELLFDDSGNLIPAQPSGTLPTQPLATQPPVLTQPLGKNGSGQTPVGTVVSSNGKKFQFNLGKIIPDLIETGRLIGNIWNNNRVFGELIKGVRPDLLQPYFTHRQVVGDEATKLAFYRRGIEGVTKASRPITSDMDRLVSYLMESQRMANLLRAEGDLVDNKEIRRTSDESNQHQWANVQRATEVANANVKSINYANALRHNLLAQKHSANWTSFDNYLAGLESRQRQKNERNQAYIDQINTYRMQEYIDSDESYQKAYKEYLEAQEKIRQGKLNRNDPEFLRILDNLRKELRRVNIEAIQTYGLAKKGMKIQYKKKDDLLYKYGKDSAEHFRKMSKLSSDALNRKRIKIDKLAPHPKPRKMQQGGVAPFTIFKPVGVGGETTISSQDTKSSSKSDKDPNIDILKSLYSQLEGLPADTNYLFDEMYDFIMMQKDLGKSVSSEDLATMYLQQLLQIINVKFSKKLYDLIYKKAEEQDALQEYAVTSNGEFWVLNSDTGKLETMSWENLISRRNKGENLNPLTNLNLLNMRAYDQRYRLQIGDSTIMQSVEGAIGISKISEFLRNQLSSLGSTEKSIEGYTKKETKEIASGVEILKDLAAQGYLESPAGLYKDKRLSKAQAELAQFALMYIKSVLPNNMKAIINAHANLNGLTEDGLIMSLLGMRRNFTEHFEIDTPSSKGSGSGKSGSGGDMTPSIAFYLGMGNRNTFVILDKTSDGLRVQTNSMPLINSEGHTMGASTLLQIEQSAYGGQLDINSATMGDAKISTIGLNEIIVPDGYIYSTELPIDMKAANDGIIKPDLSFLPKIEKADAKLREMGIVDRNNLDKATADKINQVYRDFELPIIYNVSNGLVELTNTYKRFAIFNGFASERAFDEDPDFNDGVEELSDNEREKFISNMRTVFGNEKYDLADPFIGHTERVYKGTIFVPMRDSVISALGGTGYKGTPEEYMLIDRLQQERDAALKLNYRSPHSWTNK